MLPHGLMECAAAIAAMAMLSLAGFALTCLISFRKLQIDPRLGWFLALGALSLQPVHQTFEIGQINLVLMALVMLDCLVLPPRYRGLGVGIAAAVKIIPGIFVVYFVLRRDWRAVAQSSATFAATVLASAIVTPHETMSYWTQLMSAAARTGDTISSVNQSLPAVLARPMHDRSPPTLVVVLVGLCGLALAAVAARKELARGHGPQLSPHRPIGQPNGWSRATNRYKTYQRQRYPARSGERAGYRWNAGRINSGRRLPCRALRCRHRGTRPGFWSAQ